jgi:hypothetical protein
MYTLSGAKTLQNPLITGDVIYISGGASVTRILVVSGSTVQYGSKGRTSVSPPVRGAYTGQVTSSSPTTYPNNSYLGDYWYVYTGSTASGGKWYSQHLPDNSGWDHSSFSNLSFINGSGTYIGGFSAKTAEQGCHLLSYASILYSAGLTTKTSRFDIRTRTFKNLTADPYSAVLANSNLWGSFSPNTTTNPNSSSYTITYVNTNYPTLPAVVYRDTLVANYDVSTSYDSTNLSSMNGEQRYNHIKNLLALHPEGIILRNDNLPHSIVAVGISENGNPSQDYEDRIIVCDSAATSALKGQNVRFSQCESRTRITNVLTLMNINTIGYLN